MFVKPAPGLVVREPAPSLRKLPPEGKDVPEISYWLRRLAAGDVVRVESQIPDSSEDKL